MTMPLLHGYPGCCNRSVLNREPLFIVETHSSLREIAHFHHSLNRSFAVNQSFAAGIRIANWLFEKSARYKRGDEGYDDD